MEKNLQEEFKLQDIEIARDVTVTYNCGMSRIALRAHSQIYKMFKTTIVGIVNSIISIISAFDMLNYGDKNAMLYS